MSNDQSSQKPKKERAPSVYVSVGDLKRFVAFYQAADSVNQVATKMGWKRGKVLSQASGLRKKGVPLKKLGRKHLTESDIKSLVDICEKAS